MPVLCIDACRRAPERQFSDDGEEMGRRTYYSPYKCVLCRDVRIEESTSIYEIEPTKRDYVCLYLRDCMHVCIFGSALDTDSIT